MPNFRNLSELSKYVRNNGQKVIGNQEQTKKILRQEIRKLEEILKEEIQNYYSSYQPKKYIRTFDWLNSIRVSEPIVDGNEMKIWIYFDNSLAYHPSVISDDHPDGYVITLMNSGWYWANNKQPRINRFSDYNGSHYLDKAVERYNSTNKYGLIVKLQTSYGTYGD